MKNRKKDIFLALFLTLFIICLAVVITVFFKPLYYFDIDYLNIASSTNMSKDIIKENYSLLIQYQSIFYQGTLELPNFIMSPSGRIHFEEVKKVFEIIQIVMVMSGVVSGIMIYQNLKEKDFRFLRLTSLFSVGIPSILGFFVALDFDRAFVIFHKIVFRNDFWIFNAQTDPVITILPESFFMHCFMMIITMIIVISGVFYFLYRKKRQMILNKSR